MKFVTVILFLCARCCPAPAADPALFKRTRTCAARPAGRSPVSGISYSTLSYSPPLPSCSSLFFVPLFTFQSPLCRFLSRPFVERLVIQFIPLPDPPRRPNLVLSCVTYQRFKDFIRFGLRSPSPLIIGSFRFPARAL